jgi:hypothetical protein
MKEMAVSYRLLAIELGQLLKNAVVLRDINRFAGAIFDFPRQDYPNEAITSQRAQLIYDWIMTASKQRNDTEEHNKQLIQFSRMLAPSDDLRASVDRILAVSGFILPDSDGSESSAGGLQQTNQTAVMQKLTHLLAAYDELFMFPDHQQRGYVLQDLLAEIFPLFGIPVIRSFTRNEGGEQIDGAFRLEGWHYIVECRWRNALADIRQLDGLKGQIDRSGKQTMGIFLSINGWSPNVPKLLKQNPEKAIILMDGYDLRSVLSRTANLKELVLAKLEKLNLEGEPFYSAVNYCRDFG